MTVYVVEDEETMREWLASVIKSGGHEVITFSAAQDFLDKLEIRAPSCLVLDMVLPGMTGLGLLEQIKARSICIPVIFVTSYGDVPTAVKAMKAGALDFLEKPVQVQTLLETVQQALSKHDGRRKSLVVSEEIQGLMGRLTPREREVLGLIMAGLSNKEMARKMNVSPKTIEAHRAKLYTKMRADSLADLVRKGLEANAGEPPGIGS